MSPPTRRFVRHYLTMLAATAVTETLPPAMLLRRGEYSGHRQVTV